MKLHHKQWEGGRVQRVYHEARTPLQRILVANVLPIEQAVQFRQDALEVDPVVLLQQVEHLQQAMWRHATKSLLSTPRAFWRFPHLCSPTSCTRLGGTPTPSSRAGQTKTPLSYEGSPLLVDPSQSVCRPLARDLGLARGASGAYGVAIFAELQARFPGRFPDTQVRTLQRGIGKLRAHALLTFREADRSLHLIAREDTR